MSKQLKHYEFKNRQKKFKSNVIIILENLEHEQNIGSAFRLADAFNVKKIIIVTKDTLNAKKIEKTARGCQAFVPYDICNSVTNAIEEVKAHSYTPVCVEVCDDSIPLRDCNFAKFEGVGLIVGNEKHGVSQEAMDNTAISVHIDMYGNNSSMNVSTALAITLYKCSEDQLLQQKNIQYTI